MIYNLRRAIHENGVESDAARDAAVECCHAHRMDPYTRYAYWPKIVLSTDAVEELAEPANVHAVYEWQRMIGRVADEMRL